MWSLIFLVSVTDGHLLTSLIFSLGLWLLGLRPGRGEI